jgi:orotate phosphoribosyltransferase
VILFTELGTEASLVDIAVGVTVAGIALFVAVCIFLSFVYVRQQAKTIVLTR